MPVIWPNSWARRVADHLLELAQVLEAHLLGEFIVDRVPSFGAFDAGHLHVEFGRLAGEFLDAIGVGEGHLHGQFVAGLGADQLVLEARNELAGAEFQRHILGGAAVEGLAVDLADEGDGDLVALRGLAVLGLPGLVLGGEAASASSTWASVTSTTWRVSSTPETSLNSKSE